MLQSCNNLYSWNISRFWNYLLCKRNFPVCQSVGLLVGLSQFPTGANIYRLLSEHLFNVPELDLNHVIVSVDPHVIVARISENLLSWKKCWISQPDLFPSVRLWEPTYNAIPLRFPKRQRHSFEQFKVLGEMFYTKEGPEI